MKFEMSNRLALSLPRGPAEAQYKLFLHILIRSLNVEGLQRMAAMAEILYGIPEYSKKRPVSSAEWREWADARAQKWDEVRR